MSGVAVITRPVRVSGLLSVVAAIAAAALVTDGFGGAWILLAVAVGLLVAGDALRDRAFDVAATALLIAGVVAAVAATFQAVDRAAGPASLIRVLPGLIGAVVAASGVIPLRATGSRGLLRTGTGAMFVSVVAAGVLNDASYGTLLLAGTATVVAWDLGENAIGLGEQLGRAAETLRAELVHGVGTVVVAAAAVAAGHAAAAVGDPELPLSALVLLLVAALLLAFALHR